MTDLQLSDFQIGDRVEVVQDFEGSHWPGVTGIVCDIDLKWVYFHVDPHLTGFTHYQTGKGAGFAPGNLKIVNSADYEEFRTLHTKYSQGTQNNLQNPSMWYLWGYRFGKFKIDIGMPPHTKEFEEVFAMGVEDGQAEINEKI